MKKNSASHVSRAVEVLLGKLEKNKVKRAGAVLDAWMKVTGEDEKCHAKPVSIRNGVLTVIVDNAPWMYNFTLEKRKLLLRMNEIYTGRKKIKDIRFRVGNIEK
jgi:predicted nucleic acid-binding Zn ribbon protein